MSEINLYNQDSLEAILDLGYKFDLAIVDPPYGIDIFERSRQTSNSKNDKLSNHAYNSFSDSGKWYRWEDKKWDDEPPDELFFKTLRAVSKNQIIFGANFFPNAIYPSKNWIVWKKLPDGFSQTNFELAYTSFDGPGKIFDYNQGQENGFFKNKFGGRIHPTQKPVGLYKWILTNYANEGDKILDTHLGSGSIAIACHDYGFDLEGYEIDEDYYQAAKKRLEDHQSQQKLF